MLQDNYTYDIPKSGNNLSSEVIRYVQNQLMLFCMVVIITVWVIVGISLNISYRNSNKIMELKRQALIEQIKKKEKKLAYLQKKYKKEIEMEEHANKINIFTLNYEDIDALAVNNYYESRGVGRTDWGKKRRDMENVTSVVLNRYNSGKYGKTIKQVIQKAKKRNNGEWVCQFSWVCDSNRAPINKNSREWKLAYEVAYEIYTGITPKTVKPKAMHYYNPIKSKPRWAKKAKEVAYIYGGHRVIIIE